MANINESDQATIQKGSGNVICFTGSWTTPHISHLPEFIDSMNSLEDKSVVFDLRRIDHIDPNGADILLSIVEKFKRAGFNVKLQSASEHVEAVLDMVASFWPLTEDKPEKRQGIIKKTLAGLGIITVLKCEQALAILGFLGQVFVRVSRFFPIHLRSIKQFLIHIERVGFNALPIVGLLSFLIGVVLAYQMGLQLERYGGSIFLVDFSGLAILREFGPLITAIIMAGRTGSAFTAQIASMKLSEEIAALEVMGISSFERLILPRIFAMLVSVPLVTVWANMTGILGAMVMGRRFGISFKTYLDRFAEVIVAKHYWLGMVKTPVFALIIGVIGCYQGLQVEMSSDAVGRMTTRSVVQSIFLIIVADAIFSILFSWQDI